MLPRPLKLLALRTTVGVVFVCGVGLLFGDEPALPPIVAHVLKGHSEAVYAVAYTPDGKYVVTASFDKTLKVWDAATGKEVKTFAGPQGHQNLVLGVAISPDGQLIASGGSDNQAKVWDFPSGKPVKEFAHADAVNAVALSPDGTKLAGAGKDGIIKLWSTADGKPLFEMKGHAGAVTGVSFSANGQILASSGADKTVRYWNPANGQLTATVGAHSAAATGVAIHPNNALAISAGEDGTLKFWTVPPPAARALPAHADAVTAVALSADGSQVLTASADKTARVSNFANGQQLRSLTGPTAGLTSAALAGNGMAAGGAADGRVHLWAADGKALDAVTAHTGAVTGVAFHPQSSQLLTSGADGLIKLWGLPPVPNRVLPHPDAVRAIAATADGKRLVTGCADKQVRVWAVATGMSERALSGFTLAVTCVACSADGAQITAGSEDKSVIVWNTADGKEIKKIAGLPAAVHGVGISPDKRMVAAGLADNSIRLLDIAQGKETKNLSGHAGPVRQVLFSPKGDVIISAGDDKTIKLWNGADGKLIKSIAAHDGPVTGIATNVDGTRIVSAGADKMIKVWDPAAKEDKPVRTIALTAPAAGIALSPNGQRIAVSLSAEKQNSVRIFDVASGKEVQTFPDHTAAVNALAFLADNRTVASASADKSARLSDIGVLAVLDGHAGGVSSAAFHSNGTQALSGGADKTVKLWDLTTGKVLKTLGPLPDPVSAVAFSRDFTQIGAAAGKTVKLWNAADGKELATLTHPADVTSLSFNADKTRLVTGAVDNLARVWDVATGKELERFTLGGAVRSVVFHPNNTTVVAGSADKATTVHTISAQRVIAASAQPIRALALITGGSHVLTASDDKTAKLWNIGNGANERTFAGAEGALNAVAISKNNILVATGGAEGVVRLYTFADGKQISSFKAPGPIRALNFSPNNQILLTACDDKTILASNVLYNPGQPLPPDFGKEIQRFAHAAAAVDVVFAADNSTFYSAGADKTAKAWKVASDIPKNLGHPNLVDAVAFNPAGTVLATGCHDGSLRLWDPAKAALVKEIKAHTTPNATQIYAATWTPDGKQVVSASFDQSLKLWDATSAAMVREFKAYKEKAFEKGHREGVFCAAFSPDGKQLASGSSDRSIKIWNVADGNVLRELVNPKLKQDAMQGVQSHPGWVYSVRYTSDGKHLISVGNAPRNQGYLAVWNVADGKLLYGEELPLGSFYSVALSPDGKHLAIGAGRPGQETNSSYIVTMPKLE